MSTTLTNGLKLPDKGSVDWYADMQNNYTILDNSVGTVAEHTTQIAGKASSTHTHGNISSDGKVGTTANLPLITGTGGAVQAGSFGTSANTFCEGNDSRLSDARTPVAHTHTKSDITDLLNSNFIPSANNSYNLGSSSYQWNNLYAKNYYYNGVAWGLDKANVWSANNSFYSITISGNQTNTFQSDSSVGEKGDASLFALNIQVRDKNHASWSSSGVANLGMGQDQNGSYISFALDTIDSNNTRRNNAMSFLLKPTDNSHNAYFFPNRDNTVELGTSTYKWKTLNGINPGALSLPKIVAKNTANIASAIVGADGETQYLDGTDNNYTAALDGWISICISGFVNNELWITVYDQQDEAWGTSAESSTRNTMFIIFPIRANQKMRIRMKCTSVTYARFYPCEGNV